MGNQSQSLAQAFNPPLTNWQVLTPQSRTPIWQNLSTGQLIEQYRYFSQSSSDLRKLTNLFKFRYNHEHLVSTKYFFTDHRQAVCTNNTVVSMFAERIPLRLAEVGRVPFPDVLHLYHAAVRGFALLFQKVGYFEVNEQMLGVNADGKVKVWLNQEWDVDRPVKGFWSDGKVEADMVRGVLAVLVGYEGEPTGNFTRINQELIGGHPMTFERVLRDLGSYNLKHYYTNIPDRLVTVQTLIKEGKFQPVLKLGIKKPVQEQLPPPPVWRNKNEKVEDDESWNYYPEPRKNENQKSNLRLILNRAPTPPKVQQNKLRYSQPPQLSTEPSTPVFYGSKQRFTGLPHMRHFQSNATTNFLPFQSTEVSLSSQQPSVTITKVKSEIFKTQPPVINNPPVLYTPTQPTLIKPPQTPNSKSRSIIHQTQIHTPRGLSPNSIQPRRISTNPVEIRAVSPINKTSRNIVKFNFQNPNSSSRNVVYEPKRKITTDFPQKQAPGSIQPLTIVRCHTPKFAQQVLTESNKTTINQLGNLQDDTNSRPNFIRIENRESKPGWFTTK